MLQVHLGLFDTPPSRRQVGLAVGVVVVLLLTSAFVYPARDIRWPHVDAFIPIINAIMFVGELITATLVFAQASVFRSRALTVLGSGFLVSGLLLIPHTLTFPGAFAPSGLLDAGLNTTYWLAASRRLAFPISVILYVWLRKAEGEAGPVAERPAARIAMGIAAAVVLAAADTVLATFGHDLIPPVFSNSVDLIRGFFIWYELGLGALCIAAAVVLFRKRRSVLDLWLLVGLAGWLTHTLINMANTGRFTVGFYWVFVLLLVSHFIVLLVLIAESNRLYARLALSISGWNREREARLMSVDTLAGAISHEVAQPLTAVLMNARAGQGWLRRDKPDIEKATLSLSAAIDAGQKTFDIIKSIRATIGQRPGARTEFCLNDLARATATSLDRELGGENVSLSFDLDPDLPPIVADRTQIERVIANLLTNAIESLSATRGGPRRIVVRTAPAEGNGVLLEVSDNGVGIAPQDLGRIFETFFTTKQTGTGLGLSLCRTIVEAHAGRLWASSGEGRGATFHLQLPDGEGG